MSARAVGGANDAQVPEELGRDGAAAAALMAAGIGVFTLGLVTSLAAAAEGVREWLNWDNAVGPLSGKSSLGLSAWVGSWPVLHLLLYQRDGLLPAALGITGTLVLLGMLGIFPPIFERLEP